MGKHKCIFKHEWLDSTLYPQWKTWLQAVSSDQHRVFCKACNKAFDISNMGNSVIDSHASRPTHKKNCESVKGTFWPASSNSKADSSKAKSATTAESSKSATAAESSKSTETAESSKSAETAESSKSVSAVSSQNPTLTSSFIIQHETTTAEIIWALDCVKKHRSYNSSNDQGHIFRAMYRDSAIAQRYQMANDKLAYVTIYGLSPHFSKETIAIVAQSGQFAVSFDESHNKAVHKGQMDIWLRYYDNSSDIVRSDYLTSIFLGHASSQDLLKSVIEGLEKGGSQLDIKKLLQISLDGPNVNLLFYKLFSEDFHDKTKKSLIDTGVCSLHVVSNALQHGHQHTKWGLQSILRAMYLLWKDSPARRAEYSNLTDSDQFPQKFCTTRWVENQSCCQRAISVFDNVKKFCSEVKPNPNIQSFDIVKEATRDDLCKAKLEFFKFMASEMEPFLRRFQSEKPLVPFLYEFLMTLSVDSLQRIVKASAIEECGSSFSKLKDLDLRNESNLKDSTSIDIGFGAQRALPKKLHPQRKLEFFSQCQKFLIGMIEKLFERSPLNYRSIRGASSLSPKEMVSKPNTCVKRFDVLLEELLKAEQVSVSEADSAKKQFSHFLKDNEKKTDLLNFDVDDHRLDSLYAKLMKYDANYTQLWAVTRKVLIMFHGQAAVESGFSINKDILVENLHEDSIIGQRVVYNAINFYGGVLKVPISEKLRQSVKAASMRRKLALTVRSEKIATSNLNRKRTAEYEQQLRQIEKEKSRLDEERKELDERAQNIKRLKFSIS